MSHKTKLIAIALCSLVGILASTAAQAVVVNIANGAPVIGGNSSYASNDYNDGISTYLPSNVTDGQNATPDNNTGSISETFSDGSYWLGRQGLSTGYFVLDLGASSTIGGIVLFNSSNGGPNDRGTGQFTVKGSNSITNLGGTLGSDLSGTIVTLASGTLAPQAVTGTPNPLTPQSFLSLDSTDAVRYIRFDGLSMAAGATNGLALNEIRLFVPEPASLSLLAIGGVVLLRTRGRKSAQA